MLKDMVEMSGIRLLEEVEDLLLGLAVGLENEVIELFVTVELEEPILEVLDERMDVRDDPVRADVLVLVKVGEVDE